MVNQILEQHRKHLDSLVDSGRFQTVDWDSAKTQGQKAVDSLIQFYVENGVSPEVAKEYASKLPAEELAGLRNPFLWATKCNPDLVELQTSFRELVQSGYSSDAIAVLMTDGNFRVTKTRQSIPLMYSTARDVSNKIEQLYQETLSQGIAPKDAAISVVTKMAETYQKR